MTTTTIIFFITGLLIGGIVTWLIASSRARSTEAVNNELRQQIQLKDTEITKTRDERDSEKEQRIKALAELNESLKNLEEQKAFVNTMKQDMKDTFKALSSDALNISKQDFLNLASERLRPLQDVLKKYEEQIGAIEAKRREDYGSLGEQLRMLSSTHQQLQRETSSLVTALRKPQVSGSWGQLSLKRAAELAGMTAYCDFYEEVSVDTETGRLRPDMVVRLPNGREIVVDAKAPVDAYMKAISVLSEEDRQKALSNYVSQVRAHMNALGSKSYWDQFPKSPEIVVMYLPGESFFSAALEHDHKLIEDSSLKKIVLATPTTFIALLKAIAYGWQQEQMTENAQKISSLGKELYDRINTLVKHFDDVGNALGRAINAYNKAIGSMESRVLPSVRKFKELGVAGAEEISVFEQIDQTPRNMNLIKSNPNED